MCVDYLSYLKCNLDFNISLKFYFFHIPNRNINNNNNKNLSKLLNYIIFLVKLLIFIYNSYFK